MTIEEGIELWEQDRWREACCALLPFAYGGDPNAMTIVGTLMLYGLDTFESSKAFADWQLKSDEKTKSDHFANCESNKTQAILFLTEASDKGNWIASNNLGNYYWVQGSDTENAKRLMDLAKEQCK